MRAGDLANKGLRAPVVGGGVSCVRLLAVMLSQQQAVLAVSFVVGLICT